MRKKQYIPNVFLRREAFYDICTIGTLRDADGRYLCNTMEPRWRNLSGGERKVVGQTCVPAGIYPIEFTYDTHLKYKCPRLRITPGFLNIRICFISKAGCVPKHTQGNILVGGLTPSPSPQGEGSFDGKLVEPAKAFKVVKDLFETMRANRETMVLQIEDSCHPTHFLKLPQSETQDYDLDDEDYILATL